MFKNRGFNIPIQTQELNDFKLLIKDKHRIPEETLGKLFSIIMESRKSDQTLLEQDDHEYTWDDNLYPIVFKMVSMCPTSGLTTIVKLKDLKFKTQEMPINYITKILRSGIQSIHEVNALIEPEIDSIRDLMKGKQANLEELNRVIPREFSQLINKINKMEITRESKLHLTSTVNEHHRRFQEWIQKKSS